MKSILCVPLSIYCVRLYLFSCRIERIEKIRIERYLTAGGLYYTISHGRWGHRLCVVSAMAPRAGHLNGDAGGCAKRWGGARVHSWHDPIGEIGRNAATNRWGHRL